MSIFNPMCIDLTPQERYVLVRGLAEWGGAATPTDELARAMGFRDTEDLWQGKGRELHEALRRGEHLTREDWQRTLLATEIVFASDVVGAGMDWSIATGLSDEQTIQALRAVQRKISRALKPSPSINMERDSRGSPDASQPVE